MKISHINIQPAILGRSSVGQAVSRPKPDVLTTSQNRDSFSLSDKLSRSKVAAEYVDSLELGPSRPAFTETFIEAVKQHKGEGGLTFLASPTARRQQGEQVAEGMRLDDSHGLVLDRVQRRCLQRRR